jgi:hypothetical protein
MPWLIVYMIVAIALTYALSPKQPDPPPMSLADVDVPQIEMGKPIAVAFGEVWVDDSNIIWYGDLVTSPIYASGKK